MNWAWAFTIAAVLVLLWAEHKQLDKLRAVAKTAASIGFLWAAIDAGALESRHGTILFVGLVASLAGDVLLLGTSKAMFRLGLFAFLLAHLLYTGAFFSRGANGALAGTVTMLLFPIATVIWRWLLPHLGKMRWPVLAYIAAITVMMSGAIATVRLHGGAEILAGAVLFYLSDLCVARQRFVKEGFVNKLLGLPLYYVGQLLLATFAVR